MDFLQAIILGAVEGITEFLPVSSTGHLMLAARLLHLAQSDFLKSFEIIIQLGAILSVAVLYWRELLVKREIIKKIIVAFVPTGLIGLAAYKAVKTYLLDSNAVVLWSLFLGGLIIILFEFWHSKKSFPKRGVAPSGLYAPAPPEGGEPKVENISYGQAVALGFFQSIAMIPGVSRSAATILGGLAMGIPRRTIVEFSFLLAAPTMLAATGWDLIKSADRFSLAQWDFLAVGFIVSFLVALAAIKFLLNFIRKHSFIAFGAYRMALALIFWFFVIK